MIIDDAPSSRCVVQYRFESGREHKVVIKPHGNFKGRKQAFSRTHPSTMKLLKEEALKCSPKEAVGTVYEENGGMMGATSLGQLPRNREQVSNLRRNIGSKQSLCSNKGLRDPLFTSNKNFILKYFRCRDGKRTETRIGMEGICITHSCIPPFMRMRTKPHPHPVIS